MDGNRGRCTYSASGRTLFRRDSMRFIFSICPVLTYERSAAIFRACSTLCITGPCSSGKTLILMHALADVINTYGMGERAIYLDFDLSFDLMVFEKILLTQIKECAKGTDNLVAHIEEILDRLVYLPVYDVHEVPALLVALDVYLQSSNVRVIVVDSILTKPGNVDDDVVDISLQLLQWLCTKHKLMMIYTNREGSGFTIPFKVSTLNHEGRNPKGATEPPNTTEGCDKVDSTSNILTFGLPIDWVPVPVNVAATGGGGSARRIQYIRGPEVKAESAYNYFPAQPADGLSSRSGRGGYQALYHQPDVTLCLLPCRQTSVESHGYIGCIIKGIGSDGQLNSDSCLSSERRPRSGFCHLRRLFSLSSEIAQLERVDSCQDHRSHSDFDDIHTQDLLESERLMTEAAVFEGGDKSVTVGYPHIGPSLSHTTQPSVDLDVLRTLRFGLFRIHNDKSLKEQKFALHR